MLQVYKAKTLCYGGATTAMNNAEQIMSLLETFAKIQTIVVQHGGSTRRLSPTTFEIQGNDLQEHYLLTFDPTNPLDVDIVFLTGSAPRL